MSAAPWTPGPWDFSDERMPGDDARGFWVEAPRSEFVAETLKEADARLIAAAPEMAALLDEFVAWDEGRSTDLDRLLRSRLDHGELRYVNAARALLARVNAARALLARIRGEAP